MPLLPESLIDPLWVEFAALIEAERRPEFDPAHPWGCHRRRISDRSCSTTSLPLWCTVVATNASPRRVARTAPSAAVSMTGPPRESARNCSAPRWPVTTRYSAWILTIWRSTDRSPRHQAEARWPAAQPVGRGKQGTKRSVACDDQGIPLHLVAARANDHDSPLLEPTLTGIVTMIGPLPRHRDAHGGDLFPTVHLDRGYDSGKTRTLLHTLGFTGEIATTGVPAPIQAGRRWPIERTHSWMNGYGKLRRFTDRRKIIV